MAPPGGFLTEVNKVSEFQAPVDALPEDAELATEETSDEPASDAVPEMDADPGDTSWLYSTRGPSDAVVSGPIMGGWGPGRWIANRRAAYVWAVAKYGKDRVVQMDQQTEGRWAFLIRGLRASK